METKRKTGIAVAYDRAAGTITWSDETQGTTVEPIVVRVNELSDEIKSYGLWHGIDQKVTDRGAMGRDHWDGKDKPARYATIAERMARMRRVAEQLAAGQWNARGTSDPLAGKSEVELEQLIKAAQARLRAIGVAGM